MVDKKTENPIHPNKSVGANGQGYQPSDNEIRTSAEELESFLKDEMSRVSLLNNLFYCEKVLSQNGRDIQFMIRPNGADSKGSFFYERVKVVYMGKDSDFDVFRRTDYPRYSEAKSAQRVVAKGKD